MRLLVGIDMSLSSPAVAIRWEDQTTWHVMGFCQRKCDEPFADLALHEKLRVTLSYYPLNEENRWAKSHTIVTTILDYIRRVQQTRAEPSQVHIFIENYALGMTNSSAVSKLCELGGILRYFIWSANWTFSELSPSTAKKHFAGYGKADKSDMLKAYSTKHGFPDMSVALKVKPHQHPLEDMVDAIAMLYTGVHLETMVPPPAKTAKKRRIK